METNETESHWLRDWAVLVGAVILFAIFTQRYRLVMVNDSLSYLIYPFGSIDAMMRSTRTPGYPAFLWVVLRTFGMSVIPFLQMLLHATSAWWMTKELKAWGLAGRPALAAGLAIALGCTAIDNEAILSTDLLGASAGVCTAAALLAWVRSGASFRVGIPVVLFGFVAIAIRPAYLSLIPWVTVAGTLLLIYHHRSTVGEAINRRHVFGWVTKSAAVSIGILTPVFIWMAARGIAVADFGVLPFGHQNLAGLTVQIVSDGELLAVTNNSELAKQIINLKKSYHDDRPSISRGTDGSTMTLESRWDDYVWLVIVPAADRIYPKDSIKSHREIALMNKLIIARYPLRYARWIGLAMRRACWGTAANMVMHPLFLVCLMVAIAVHLTRMMRGKIFAASTDPAIAALFIIAATYFFVNVGFVVLTSPPLGRFADACAIFVPAWIAARWVH